MPKKETIIVFSAHTDDYVIGAGGSIGKYVREGKKVIAVVFSFGEKGYFWMKEHLIKKAGAKESVEASTLLGCETVFLHLRDQHIAADYKKKKIEKKLLTLLNKQKPTKIFTHSSEDPHPDHRAVHHATIAMYEKLRHKPEVYTYSVWNPVSIKTLFPALYVDVTKTFKIKMKALKTFESQKIHIAYPVILLVFRAIKDGFRVKGWLGEHFFKIR